MLLRRSVSVQRVDQPNGCKPKSINVREVYQRKLAAVDYTPSMYNRLRANPESPLAAEQFSRPFQGRGGFASLLRCSVAMGKEGYLVVVFSFSFFLFFVGGGGVSLYKGIGALTPKKMKKGCDPLSNKVSTDAGMHVCKLPARVQGRTRGAAHG